MTWDEVVAHALALPGTEATTYYGGPAVKANGHPLNHKTSYWAIHSPPPRSSPSFFHPSRPSEYDG